MARIIATIIASVCFLTLAAVPQPASAARPTYQLARGGDGWCC